ncbi:MAG: anaerobic ribonucleoside triphosphate reductase [Candidatus Nomurabacteria bacterium]|jgi:ribonucleoside-triphosphate reductase|nr:anaerobic ribonucleoside triphosphate reductase [Candidatus Nomurabacteria bacterium]
MYKSIRKRDGKVVQFNLEKISDAITKAANITEEFDNKKAGELAEKVLVRAKAKIKEKIPSVEQIQDIVEEVLLESKYKKTAKEYIAYRQERSQIRAAKTNLMQIYKTIAHAKAEEDSDVKRGNANVDGDTAMGKMLQFGAEGSKEFAKTFLMKPEHALAHDNGDIHIHDLDFWATGTLTCCQSDPLKLFAKGFNTGHGFLRTPNSIGSYAALAAILLQANQNEQHGGQSIPNFDYAMAPGVVKTFRKSVVSNLAKIIHFTTDKKIDVEKIKAVVEKFEQKTKLTYPQLAKKPLKTLQGLLKSEIGANLTEKQLKNTISEATIDTENQTFQAMEGLVHNLNTMHSRAGAQVPFTSINFGTDISPEGRLVIKAFLEATMKGLGRGETPIFPISIFKVKEGVNYNPEDPNYDLYKRSMEVSSKRLFPNFTFLDAPFNLKYYKAGDYTSEVATMGCRTRVIASIFPESDGVTPGRGNCSFTTINLPRIGLKNGVALGRRKEGDWDKFYKDLDKMIDIAAAQLLERFEFQAECTVRNFPFLMGEGNWFGSDKLKPNDKLRDVIKHGTLSIGFIGLAEALVAMTGEHHGESEEMQELGLEIVGHMRDRIDELAQKHQLNYSLLATPAEGLSGRFTKIDCREFGEIKGVNDRDFYTNSYHVPVYYNIGAFEKIEKEAPYHNLCNAGHITYVELDGDTSNNIEAFEAIIRKMKDAGVGYGSVNHPVDRDPMCGFSGIISGDICPSCGRKESDGEFGFERLRRITGYLVGSLERWNDAKKAEEKARVKHSIKAEKEVKKQAQKKAIGKV